MAKKVGKKKVKKAGSVVAIEGGFDLVVQPERKVNISELTIQRIVWLPQEGVVLAKVKEANGPVTLWEDAAYDDLNGQVTLSDIEARLKEVLGIPS